MWQGKRILAVVPARGGSKGIPRKNLCCLGGQSLIAWVASLTQKLPWIDRSVLSTDDEEIAEEGRRIGLEVPFLRPKELATDTAHAVDVWRHAWATSEAYWGETFDLSLYLQPTTPFRKPEHIKQLLEAFLSGSYEAATTVAPVPGHFVPEKIFQLDSDGCLRAYCQQGAISNRQQAPRYYYRTGACYLAWRETIIEKRCIVEGRCLGVVIEDIPAGINIDDPVDLEFAEFIFQKYIKR